MNNVKLIPIVFGLLIVLVIAVFIIYRFSKVKWAKGEGLAEIEQLCNELKFTEAFRLIEEAKRFIPKDTRLKELDSLYSDRLTILTDPPGARVFIREYSDPEGDWQDLGKTPVEALKLPAYTFFLMRIEKEGYENLLTLAFANKDTLLRKLFHNGTIPEGMVYVEGYWDEVNDTILKDSCGFFIDRYEVTNKEYKEFIDKGCYKKPEYWKNEFIKDGKKLKWEEAVALFTDRTGRPGPSTWEAGDYPDDQDNYPVSGISWFEAAAYAEFTGKKLPTADHWDSGAGFFSSTFYGSFGSRILPLSNFRGKGSDPVGMNQGINYFGTYDMAGNVREWCWNETTSGRIFCGGGWNDATYLYYSWNQLSPFDRSAENGFRCVKYIEPQKIPETAFRTINLSPGVDYSKEIPVAEDVFRIYKNQFLYDKADLNAVTEEKDESHKDWIVEKISFDAAYEKGTMIIYLYLPKNLSPPYQTMIFYPGSYGVWEKDVKKTIWPSWFFDYILKSGRAVVYPVYYGTYERNEGMTVAMHNPSQTHQYTERLVKWTKDFSRTIDYLETRPDIDSKKLGFYGHSWGGVIGGIIPAVEDRLTVNVLILGGFWGLRALPEASEVNYVPRVKIPTLMLNGRYDSRFPEETNLLPFFNLLGTPDKDKRLCVYETDHYVTKSDMIREVLGWLDKYLGDVSQ